MMLADAVLTALRPRSVGERVRVRLTGGWTALQVRERLPPEAVASWLAAQPGGPEVANRRLIEAVRDALVGLVAAGRAHRRTSRLAVELRSKGSRDVVVDLFRA